MDCGCDVGVQRNEGLPNLPSFDARPATRRPPAVDRFDCGSDDEQRGWADAPVGLDDRARSFDLLPPEQGRHGHLRPRILSWRNARIRLVQRSVPGLQRPDRRSTSPSSSFQNLAKLQPDGEFISTWFAASVEETFRHYKLWQLLTATFFHGGIMHLIMNMWFFWIVAREMEPLYGSRDFLAFYLVRGHLQQPGLALVCRGLTTKPATDDRGLGRRHRRRDALHAVLPEARDAVRRHSDADVDAAWRSSWSSTSFPVLNGGDSHVAVEAHLAGAASRSSSSSSTCGGRGWSRVELSRPRLRIFTPVPREPSRSRSSSPSRSTASVGAGPKSPSVSVLPEEQLDARLDEVLAKIAREGRSGLTEEELRVLQEASRRARIKRSDRP